jgi:quinoprotein glucose dehydrogenase
LLSLLFVAALAPQDVWAEGLEEAVSISVDDRGRIFVVLSDPPHRLAPSLKDRDLSSRTVAEREALFGGEGSATRKDRVLLLEDRDGDGKAETSSVFTEGFNRLLDGPPSGILARRGEVWVGSVPSLWRLRDRDNDGKVEDRKPVHGGFGVHAWGGGLSAIAFGQDGKLYLAMGDRGFVARSSEGERLEYPDMGAVLRCDPDGSNLEVFAIGFQDPRDLAFDAHGNLWILEQDGRWMWVVEGGDGGARAGWTAEAAGATALPAAGKASAPGRFVVRPDGLHLCGPNGIRSFGVKPKGAGFEVSETGVALGDLAVLDADVGPDGSLFVLAGGKIRRVPGTDAETAKILAEPMSKRPVEELPGLMGHADLRVRTAAQHELVGRQGSTQALVAITKNPEAPRLARLHAVWGLGQLYTRNPLFPLLRDKDPEVRAQTAKVLGERRVGDAFNDLLAALKDESPRVRLFAAIAIGRIGRREAVKPILEMLRANDDADPYLRHAGVFALASINDGQALREAAKDPSKGVRIAALVAMRRCGRQDATAFLEDADPAIVLEAARAIHDLPISGAMPRLAELLDKMPEPAMSRSINANFRWGTPEAAKRLAAFAARAEIPEAMRLEAVRALVSWGTPGGRDRVTGLWRPLGPRDPAPAQEALKSVPPALRAAAEGK